MSQRLGPDEMRALLAGETIASLFSGATRQYATDEALRTRELDGQWTSWTYAEYGRQASAVAAGLKTLGVSGGDRVSLLLRNRPEFYAIDMGALLLRATPTSIYNSSSPEQIRYLVEHAESQVVVVDGPESLGRLLDAHPYGQGPRHIVSIDDPQGVGGTDILRWEDLACATPLDLEEAAAAVLPEDIATIIFTSGTTGPPKGAQLSHAGLRALTESLSNGLGEGFTRKRVVSYMPMAHIAERGNTLYLPLRDGHTVTTVPEVAALAGYLPVVRPQYFFGPPRIWEKLWTGVQQAIAGSDGPSQVAFRRALEVGALLLPDRRLSRELSAADAQLWAEVEPDAKLLLSFVALDEVEIAITAAAAMPASVLDGFLSLNVNLTDGYGMTECGTATLDPHFPRRGAVGRPLSGTSVRLAIDGEIELNSAAAFVGYLKDEEKTKEAFTPDGWLRTGDVGSVDAEGYLTLIDRKKDLIITAGGKNISPLNIESQLAQHPLVANAVVVGEGRRFIAALLVLDEVAAAAWADRHALPGASLAELAESVELNSALQVLVDSVNESLSRVEQVKRFHIVPHAWYPDSEEMTPTMKVRRRLVTSKYADAIDALYK